MLFINVKKYIFQFFFKSVNKNKNLLKMLFINMKNIFHLKNKNKNNKNNKI
jgi:hypothetical protein